MNHVNILGWIASIITVIYTSLGLPAQILKNIRLKSTKGLSLFLFSFLFLTFLSWVVYGFTKADWFIVVPNGLGAFCAFVLVFQITYYSIKSKRGHEHDKTIK